MEVGAQRQEPMDIGALFLALQSFGFVVFGAFGSMSSAMCIAKGRSSFGPSSCTYCRHWCWQVSRSALLYCTGSFFKPPMIARACSIEMYPPHNAVLMMGNRSASSVESLRRAVAWVWFVRVDVRTASSATALSVWSVFVEQGEA